MKRLLSAIALTCILAVSTLAGDLPTSGVPSPAPPAGTTQTTSATTPGDLPTGGYAEQMSDAALSALLTVLGLVAV